MKTVLLQVTMLLFAACAPPPTPAGRSDRVIATTEEGVIRANAEPVASAAINASVDAVFNALPDVYRDVGVEVKFLDPATHSIGNKRFTKLYRFAGDPLGAYFGCGASPTGPIANNDRITISAVSGVTPAGNTSQLQTTVTAYAEDMSLSKGKISCVSTGKLEEKIRALVEKRLGQ